MDPFYSRKGLATFLGIRMSVLLDGGSCFMYKFRDIICRKVPVTLDLLEELLEVLLDDRSSEEQELGREGHARRWVSG